MNWTLLCIIILKYVPLRQLWLIRDDWKSDHPCRVKKWMNSQNYPSQAMLQDIHQMEWSRCILISKNSKPISHQKSSMSQLHQVKQKRYFLQTKILAGGIWFDSGAVDWFIPVFSGALFKIVEVSEYFIY